MKKHNGSQQRHLTLPGEGRRLTREEVAEQAQKLLDLVQSQNRRRMDPMEAPRRAVADVRGSTVRLVCGHDIEVPVAATIALSYRCTSCQREGRP